MLFFSSSLFPLSSSSYFFFFSFTPFPRALKARTAIRPRRCLSCSTPSRTRTSSTTTWTCRWTCPRCFSSARPTSSKRSRARCSTAWRSLISPATLPWRRWRLRGSTCPSPFSLFFILVGRKQNESKGEKRKKL